MNEQTRVAFVLPSLERGGYWHPVFRQLTSIFPNTVICTQIWPGFVAGCEGSFQVRNYGGRQRLNQPIVWGSPRVIPDLVRFRPRVVLTSGFHVWALYLLLLKPFMNWRIILLWDGVSPQVAHREKLGRTYVRRLMARGYDLCLTNTIEALEYLRNTLHVRQSRLACRPYEVPDIELMDQLAEPPAKLASLPRPVFLFAGEFIARKGMDALLEAAHVLKSQGLNRFSIALIGGGPLFEKIQKLASDLGLSEHIVLERAVPYHRMGAYYRACDVFVFPTREDIWGMVALEAMAFGKPIICSRHAGARELVREGENGYIVEPADATELADRMARFIRNPELIARFASVSRTIMTPHTASRASLMLADTIREVLKGEPDRSAAGVTDSQTA